MVQKIGTPISVVLRFDSQKRQVWPESVFWHGRTYPVRKVGLHHCFRRGRTLYHVFSVASSGLFFRLLLNTENLFWILEAVADGLPD